MHLKTIDELRCMPAHELAELRADVVRRMCAFERAHNNMWGERKEVSEDLIHVLQDCEMVCFENDKLICTIAKILTKKINAMHKNIRKFDRYKRLLCDAEQVMGELGVL